MNPLSANTIIESTIAEVNDKYPTSSNAKTSKPRSRDAHVVVVVSFMSLWFRFIRTYPMRQPKELTRNNANTVLVGRAKLSAKKMGNGVMNMLAAREKNISPKHRAYTFSRVSSPESCWL